MNLDDAEQAIVYHALQCEESLRLADFSENEPLLGARLAASLRKYASISSEDAFAHSRTVLRLRSAA